MTVFLGTSSLSTSLAFLLLGCCYLLCNARYQRRVWQYAGLDIDGLLAAGTTCPIILQSRYAFSGTDLC